MFLKVTQLGLGSDGTDLVAAILLTFRGEHSNEEIFFYLLVDFLLLISTSGTFCGTQSYNWYCLVGKLKIDGIRIYCLSTLIRATSYDEPPLRYLLEIHTGLQSISQETLNVTLLRQGTLGAPGVDLDPEISVPNSSTHQQCPVLGWHWVGVKLPSSSQDTVQNPE